MGVQLCAFFLLFQRETELIMTYPTDDLRINAIKELMAPETLHNRLAITEQAANTVYKTRQSIHHLLKGEDDRLLMIVGPCSVHDTAAAHEYARKLKPLHDELHDDLIIVMRVYFEKPRTTVGWKGMINDPDLNGTFHINKGIEMARELLLHVNDMGLPAGTEFLDLISPQYIADLISWGAIGARTTESQVHRELASGLSSAVGFKNATNGSLQVAMDAMRSAAQPHHFLSVTKQGRSAIFSTTGNKDTHVILRGGERPNYDTESINIASEKMANVGLEPRLMIDCSHANSRKNHLKQIEVGHNMAEQIARGDKRIIGGMIESNLVEGRQDWKSDGKLIYGKSITDACIKWDDTEPLLHILAEAVRERRAVNRGQAKD